MTLNSDKRKEETKAEEEAAGFPVGTAMGWLLQIGYPRKDSWGRNI